MKTQFFESFGGHHFGEQISTSARGGLVWAENPFGTGNYYVFVNQLGYAVAHGNEAALRMAENYDGIHGDKHIEAAKSHGAVEL